MSFKAWVIQYKNKNSRRGDLAYDVFRDSHFPRGSDKAVFLHYLKYVRHAHPDAIVAFREAFRAYECWRKRYLDSSLLEENQRLEAKIRELEGEDQEITRKPYHLK